MDPSAALGMISGNPSFQGGASGPAFSEASSSAHQGSDFTVYGSGSDTRNAIQWGAVVLISVVAIWAATRN